MVSLSATDANSEKKWKGFSNSLSMTELQEELYVYWKTSRHEEGGEILVAPFESSTCQTELSIFDFLTWTHGSAVTPNSFPPYLDWINMRENTCLIY